MITFRKVEEHDLQLILDWRTSEHVTQYMYTDIEKNIDNQKKWFEKIVGIFFSIYNTHFDKIVFILFLFGEK